MRNPDGSSEIIMDSATFCSAAYDNEIAPKYDSIKEDSVVTPNLYSEALLIKEPPNMSANTLKDIQYTDIKEMNISLMQEDATTTSFGGTSVGDVLSEECNLSTIACGDDTPSSTTLKNSPITVNQADHDLIEHAKMNTNNTNHTNYNNTRFDISHGLHYDNEDDRMNDNHQNNDLLNDNDTNDLLDHDEKGNKSLLNHGDHNDLLNNNNYETNHNSPDHMDHLYHNINSEDRISQNNSNAKETMQKYDNDNDVSHYNCKIAAGSKTEDESNLVQSKIYKLREFNNAIRNSNTKDEFSEQDCIALLSKVDNKEEKLCSGMYESHAKDLSIAQCCKETVSNSERLMDKELFNAKLSALYKDSDVIPRQYWKYEASSTSKRMGSPLMCPLPVKKILNPDSVGTNRELDAMRYLDSPEKLHAVYNKNADVYNIPMLDTLQNCEDAHDGRRLLERLDAVRVGASKDTYKRERSKVVDILVSRASTYQKVSGIYFDKHQLRWSVGWTFQGRRVAKYFPVKLYGLDEGYHLAVAFKKRRQIFEHKIKHDDSMEDSKCKAEAQKLLYGIEDPSDKKHDDIAQASSDNMKGHPDAPRILRKHLNALMKYRKAKEDQKAPCLSDEDQEKQILSSLGASLVEVFHESMLSNEEYSKMLVKNPGSGLYTLLEALSAVSQEEKTLGKSPKYCRNYQYNRLFDSEKAIPKNDNAGLMYPQDLEPLEALYYDQNRKDICEGRQMHMNEQYENEAMDSISDHVTENLRQLSSVKQTLNDSQALSKQYAEMMKELPPSHHGEELLPDEKSKYDYYNMIGSWLNDSEIEWNGDPHCLAACNFGYPNNKLLSAADIAEGNRVENEDSIENSATLNPQDVLCANSSTPSNIPKHCSDTLKDALKEKRVYSGYKQFPKDLRELCEADAEQQSQQNFRSPHYTKFPKFAQRHNQAPIESSMKEDRLLCLERDAVKFLLMDLQKKCIPRLLVNTEIASVLHHLSNCSTEYLSAKLQLFIQYVEHANTCILLEPFLNIFADCIKNMQLPSQMSYGDQLTLISKVANMPNLYSY